MSVLGVNGRPKSCPQKLGGSVDVDSLQPTTVGAIHEPLRLKPGGYLPFESDEKECHAANDLWPYRGIPPLLVVSEAANAASCVDSRLRLAHGCGRGR